MALVACPRPNCFSCAIEAQQRENSYRGADKSVGFDRHALPHPLKDNSAAEFKEWVAGLTERVREVYGPEVNDTPQWFNPDRARGIKGHVQQINNELARADFHTQKARETISDTQFEVAAIQVPDAMNELYNVAVGVSNVAKAQVNWRGLGVNPEDATIYFPGINRQVCLV